MPGWFRPRDRRRPYRPLRHRRLPGRRAAGGRLGPARDRARERVAHAAAPGGARSRQGVHEPRRGALSARHLLAQMEQADASDDPAQRRELCLFVVVGAGTRQPRSPRKGSGSPGPRCAATRGSTRMSCDGCWWTRPPPSCRSWARNWAARPCAFSAAAGSTCGSRPRSRRSPAGGSGSPTARRCPPAPWSGVSA